MSLRVVGSLALSLVAVSTGDVSTVTLNNGVEMPMLLFGDAGAGADMGKSKVAEEHVRQALHAGFPGVDTANNYLNQKGVGKALAEFDRKSYFLTTKVGGFDVVGFPGKEYRGTLNAAHGDLKKLGVDYVDLMLLHYPPIKVLGNRCKVMQEQWRALEDFMKGGKARAIGVSNYCQAELECLFQTATVVPAVNQIMYHVGMGTDPRGVRTYGSKHGLVTQAYSPLGGFDSKLKKDHSLITGNFTKDIGKVYNKTGAQVALRWVVQQGVPLTTASSSMKHLLQDLAIFNFSFADADMKALDEADTPAGEPNSFGHAICAPTPTAALV